MIVDDEQQDSARGFDPRYDPSFQRGYRPQPGERPRTRLRAAPAGATAQGAARPAQERRREQEVEAAPVEAAALSIVASPEAEAVVVPAAPEPSPQPAATIAAGPGVLDRLELSPRRNPLMLALWLVGGGFVVLGIVLYSVSVSLSYSAATPSSDVGTLVISQLGWMLAGPLITIGLATLVALLFLTALAGRRRTPAAPDPAELPDDEGY